MEKTSSTSLFKPNSYTVERVVDLNFFSVIGEGTKGSNNKFYHIELHVSGTKAQLYTEYGPTGRVQVREYRHYDDKASAEKEFNSIVKSKVKKGYKEIDVAKRAIGTEEAKKIIKPVVFSNTTEKSSLHKETARLIKELRILLQ